VSASLTRARGAELPALLLADKVVAKLRDAAEALQYATTIQQAKVIADVAEAQRVFAQRQQLGDVVTGYAHEIKIHALAKLGELLAVMPKATGAKGIGPVIAVPGENRNQPATYRELGLSKKTAASAQELAALPLETRDAIAKQEVSLRDVQRDGRREARVDRLTNIALGNTPLCTERRYPIIYADPPWRYEQVRTDSRAIENHYPTMPLEDICAVDVGALATDDAVLFLWVPMPKLEEGLQVVRAWGFRYRTGLVWDKGQIGMGHYVRQQHELVFVAVKGDPPTPPDAARPASVVHAPRGAHSVKPAVFYELIERMYPTFPKIELFARTARAGWAAWGNQAATEVLA